VQNLNGDSGVGPQPPSSALIEAIIRHSWYLLHQGRLAVAVTRSAGMTEHYDGHQLCDTLIAGQMCFRVDVYQSGVYNVVFHEHIPAHRIPETRANEVLRSLAARYSDWPGKFILQSHLNRRGQEPACYPGFIHHLSYPEPGVVRTIVSTPTAHAWRDVVVSKANFRSQRLPSLEG
jgi:hypothetical protein